MCHLQHDLQAHDDGFILVTCVLALVTRIPASMTRVIIIYSHSLQSAECHGTRGSTGALHMEGGGYDPEPQDVRQHRSPPELGGGIRSCEPRGGVLTRLCHLS
jgi:hypothetical protein